MTELKPYPGYKDSGFEWTGVVPQDWPTTSVRRSAYVKARVGWKGLTSDEFEDVAHAYLVTGTDFKGKFIDWCSCYQVSLDRYQDDPYIQLRNEDLLITKDGTIGKIAVVRGLDKPACLNSGIFVVRPVQALSSEYLYWVLESRVFRQFVRAMSTGSTIMHLYQNVFVQFSFPNPSAEEQVAITSFLDHETAEIDAFIADQQELIRLLNERRAATITRAVTKGLNPAAPMRSSNVEWFREVPTHWVVKGLKRFISKVDQGVSPEASAELADGDSVGVLKAGCVNGGIFVDTEHKRLPDPFSYEERLQVSVGDLIVNRASGSPNLVGSAALVRQLRYNLILSDKTFRLRPNSSCLPAYLERVLNSAIYRMQVRAAINGAEGLANNLPLNALRRFLIPAPPLIEQQEIVDYLDHESAEIDSAIADAKEAIELLKERREALISAAVTGRIDVRDHPAAKGTI